MRWILWEIAGQLGAALGWSSRNSCQSSSALQVPALSPSPTDFDCLLLLPVAAPAALGSDTDIISDFGGTESAESLGNGGAPAAEGPFATCAVLADGIMAAVMLYGFLIGLDVFEGVSAGILIRRCRLQGSLDFCWKAKRVKRQVSRQMAKIILLC